MSVLHLRSIMPKIVYVNPDATERVVEADDNQSIMRAAIFNGVDGIVGECGGQAMCATCHVYVEHVDGRLPEISEDEEEMLECTADEQLENSRLGCQISAGQHFNEIRVRLPESQI